MTRSHIDAKGFVSYILFLALHLALHVVYSIEPFIQREDTTTHKHGREDTTTVHKRTKRKHHHTRTKAQSDCANQRNPRLQSKIRLHTPARPWIAKRKKTTQTYAKFDLDLTARKGLGAKHRKLHSYSFECPARAKCQEGRGNVGTIGVGLRPVLSLWTRPKQKTVLRATVLRTLF